jgi:hypothetical protein
MPMPDIGGWGLVPHLSFAAFVDSANFRLARNRGLIRKAFSLDQIGKRVGDQRGSKSSASILRMATTWTKRVKAIRPAGTHHSNPRHPHLSTAHRVRTYKMM